MNTRKVSNIVTLRLAKSDDIFVVCNWRRRLDSQKLAWRAVHVHSSYSRL